MPNVLGFKLLSFNQIILYLYTKSTETPSLVDLTLKTIEDHPRLILVNLFKVDFIKTQIISEGHPEKNTCIQLHVQILKFVGCSTTAKYYYLPQVFRIKSHYQYLQEYISTLVNIQYIRELILAFVTSQYRILGYMLSIFVSFIFLFVDR